MNKIKKALLMALSLAMSATLFAACGKDKGGSTNSSESSSVESSAPVSSSEEDSSDEDSSVEDSSVEDSSVEDSSSEEDSSDEVSSEESSSEEPELSDTTKPEFSTIDETQFENVKVGDTITIPTVTATDETDGDVTVYVSFGTMMFQNPVQMGEEKIMETAGNYVIKYSAQDEAGNVAEKTINVTVVCDHEYIVENKDETNHWLECECGEINQDSVTAHEYTIENKNATDHWLECECGATFDVTAHNAAEDAEWTADAENHWKECDCGVEVEKAAHSGEYTYDDNGDTHTKSNACCGFEVETVKHNYNLWDTTNANYDYKACECGAKDTTQAFDKSVSLINQDVLLTDSELALNISGIEYASIVSITLGDYDFGTDPAALVISEEFKADTKNHGKQTVVITVKDAEEAEHAISVPVTFITKEIATTDDFKSIQPSSEVKGVWGYYVLTANISDTGLASLPYVGDWEATTGFFATLDGAGHTISAAANGAGGLFGILRSATIKNLTITDNWRSAWSSGGAALLAKACFNSTLENVTFTYVAGNTSDSLGNGYGWLCCAEFSGNLVKNVTVNDTQGYGSLFGYKFYNNVFDHVTINGEYKEMGHTAPVVDEEGNEVEGKSVTYEEVTKAEAVEMEKVTLETRQDFVLEGAVSTLDLGDYNDATIIAIKTSTGYELYGLSSDVATSSFKEAKEFHGEQNIIVTVKTADGKLLEVTVPVTVITKAISTMADLQTAVKHMGTNLYGYYVLTNNVAYTEEGYVGQNASYGWSTGTGFKGTLDGRGYTITMAGNNSQHGLFGTLNGATVKNVNIINAWYNGWSASTLGYTAYNTTFDNVTITIYGNTIAVNPTTNVGAVIGAETGGCTWTDVTINVDQAQGTLFETINKGNTDTFEDVVVNIPSLTQFSDQGKPDGVTIITPEA